MSLSRTHASGLLVTRSLQRSCYRVYGSEATSAPNPKASEGQYIHSKRSAFLRTSTFLRSPVEALAVIRAVERKYGAIREYRFTKDYELPSRYQNKIHVSFCDARSFERIPVTGETVSVNLPSITPDRPGGIGLEDLEPVLERQGYVADVDIPAFGNIMNAVIEDRRKKGVESQNIVEVKVLRSGVEVFSSPPTPNNFYIRNGPATARNFLHWGGFHELQPITAGTPIAEGLLYTSPNVDHAQMRLVLRRYSDASKVANPYEIPSTSEIETLTTQLPQIPDGPAWEPLPGHESVPEDTPMRPPVILTPPPSRTESALITADLVSVPNTPDVPSPTSSTSMASPSTSVASDEPVYHPTNTPRDVSPPLSIRPLEASLGKARRKVKATKDGTRSLTSSSKINSQRANAQGHEPQPTKASNIETGRKSTGNQKPEDSVKARLKQFLGGWIP